MKAAFWILLISTIFLYFTHPAYETYGLDFFRYWTLSKTSQTHRGAEIYTDMDAVRKVQAEALLVRLKDDQEIRERLGFQPDLEWILKTVPTLPDPRSSGSILPLKYLVEWDAMYEYVTTMGARMTPAAFGIVRAVGLDRFDYKKAFFLWNFFAIFCILLGVYLLQKTIGFTEIPFPLVAFLVLWFDPVRTALLSGQVMELLFLITVVVMFLIDRAEMKWPMLAGVLLGFGLVTKPLVAGLVVFLVWSVLFREKKRPYGVALFGFCIGSICTVAYYEWLLGAGIWDEWLRTFPTWYQQVEFHIGSISNRSPIGAAISWFGVEQHHWFPLYFHRVYVAAILSFYVYWFLIPANRARMIKNSHTAFCLALMGPILISRFALFHYGVLLIVPFFVVLHRLLVLYNSQKESSRAIAFLLLLSWFGIGFYETFRFLLLAKSEVIFYPILAGMLVMTRSPDTPSEDPQHYGAPQQQS